MPHKSASACDAGRRIKSVRRPPLAAAAAAAASARRARRARAADGLRPGARPLPAERGVGAGAVLRHKTRPSLHICTTCQLFLAARNGGAPSAHPPSKPRPPRRCLVHRRCLAAIQRARAALLAMNGWSRMRGYRPSLLTRKRGAQAPPRTRATAAEVRGGQRAWTTAAPRLTHLRRRPASRPPRMGHPASAVHSLVCQAGHAGGAWHWARGRSVALCR